jgi:hypothetical protein
MPWKTGDIIIRILGTKKIQKEEGVEQSGFVKPENPQKAYACPITGPCALNDAGNLSD